MAYNTVNGHTFTLSVKTGESTWTEVKGINTLTFTPSAVKADATTFDTAGWKKEVIVERGLEISVAGLAVYDETDNDKDAGQAAVEAYGEELGADAVGTFSIAVPGGSTYEFDAAVEKVTIFGGGVRDLAKWETNLTVTGKPSIVTPPVGP